MLIFHALLAIILFPRLLPCGEIQASAVADDDEKKVMQKEARGEKVDQEIVTSDVTTPTKAKIQVQTAADLEASESSASLSSTSAKSADKTTTDQQHHQDRRQNQTAQTEGKSSRTGAKINKLKFFQTKKMSLSSLLSKPSKNIAGESSSSSSSSSPPAKSSTAKSNNQQALHKKLSQNHQLTGSTEDLSPFDIFQFQNQPAPFAGPVFPAGPSNPFAVAAAAAAAYMQMQPFHQHGMFNLAAGQAPPMMQQQQQQLGSNNLNEPHPNSIDENTAQSMDNYRRIRYTKQLHSPMYFATGGPINGSAMQYQQADSKQQHQQQQQQSQNANSLIGSAAAALLLTEKAKSLLSQINLGNNNNASQSNSSSSSSSSRNNNINREPVGSSSSNIRSASNGDAGMASMLKSAAEAWAVSGNTGTGNTPTIVVEHDGPSITTVDFNNLPARLNGPVDGDDDDSEDVSDFYSEENDEADSEGSHRMPRKIGRPKRQHLKNVVQQQDQQVHLSSQQQHDNPSVEYFYGSNSPSPLQDHHSSGLRWQQKQPAGDTADEGFSKYEPPSAQLQHQNNNNNYPDSINAIKDREKTIQQEADGVNSGSLIREKLGGSSSGVGDDDDQIESLIRELQDLKRKKSSDRLRGARNRGRHSSSHSSFEEYDDSSSDENNNNNHNNDDDEDEQTGVLKKKLLARLRNKHERRKHPSQESVWGANNNGKGSHHHHAGLSSSTDGSPAVKIPLHALLLAALDRRMSPSEQSQTLAASSDALILDDRSKEVITSAQNDFNEVTSNLDSLMDSNRLYESLISSPSPPTTTSTTSTTTTTTTTTTTSTSTTSTTTTPAPPSQIPEGGSFNLAILNESSVPLPGSLEQEFYKMAASQRADSSQQNTYGIDSKFAVEHPLNSSTVDVAEPFESNNIDGAAITLLTDTNDSAALSGSNQSGPEELQTMSATTRTPLTSDRQRDDDHDFHRPRSTQGHHQRGLQDDDDDKDDNEDSVNAHHHPQSKRPTKGRRELSTSRADEGDFDVSKQVEDFSQDNEAPLEPAWMRRRHERKTSTTTTSGGRSRPSNWRARRVDFDDEDDAGGRMGESRGKRVLKRKRPPPSFDDTSYEDNENKFFESMHRDTTNGAGANDDPDADIEQNSSGIENPVESASEDRPRSSSSSGRTRPTTTRARVETDQEDDEDSDESSTAEDDNPEPNSVEDRNEGNRQKAPHSNWRPNMVDHEVQKLEQEAKQKQVARRRRERESPRTRSINNSQRSS